MKGEIILLNTMFHTRINKYIIKVYVNITINIVFFLVMYNINLHIESLPWERNTFYWLIHDNRGYNRIVLYEIISILALLAGYFYLSNLLAGASWSLIILADKFGYIRGNYEVINYSPDVDYGWAIYTIGMMIVLTLGCIIEVLLYKQKRKYVKSFDT